MLVLEAHPQVARRPALGQGRPQLERRELELEAVELRAGPLDIAEVGHEAPDVGADHGEPVGAGEARQVAQVDQVGDQQQVELALGQPRRDAVRAAHASAAFSRSSATR